jgi:DNA-binding IclR family transcriptional regulator
VTAITGLLELDAEVERVRRRGWADAFEEREIGLNAVVAPAVVVRRQTRRNHCAAVPDSALRAAAARAALRALGAGRCTFPPS